MVSTGLDPSTALTGTSSPQLILQVALAALSEGKISEVVDQFDDHFTFIDHALTLEFADKGRLTEFFQKARELFPDSMLEVGSIFECGEHALAEWKPSVAQTVPYGSVSYRFPIILPGSTIVRIKDGGIARWADYDQNTSRRASLAVFFTEWVECQPRRCACLALKRHT